VKIIIMRHAKVQIENRKIYANELKNLIEEYNQAPIEEHIENFDELKKLADEVNFTVSSGLRRSVESLALLGREPDDRDEIFAEVESPYIKRKIMKLSLYTWGFWFKLLWRLGYSGGSRSYRESQADALKASIKLEGFAKEHDKVLLLGHGLKNMLIAKALKSRGWQESKKMSLKNWGYGIYERI
jgi:broad specificity phosphatase PhoE